MTVKKQFGEVAGGEAVVAHVEVDLLPLEPKAVQVLRRLQHQVQQVSLVVDLQAAQLSHLLQ